MLVKCRDSFVEERYKNFLTRGATYPVLQMTIYGTLAEGYYKIIDDDGVPANFSLSQFTVESDSVDNFVLFLETEKFWGLALTRSEFVNTGFERDDKDDFFGRFFNDFYNVEMEKYLQAAVNSIMDEAGLPRRKASRTG